MQAAHQAAQARLGVSGAYLALADWGAVSATNAAATSGSWLSRSVRVIAALRRRSSRLAIAYYQLGRALDTGATLGLPEYSDDPNEVTIGGLRQQFLGLLLEISTMGTEAAVSDDEDVKWMDAELQAVNDDNPRAAVLELQDIEPHIQALLDLPRGDDGSKVTVDDFEWPADWTTQEVEDAFRSLLKAEAVDRSAKWKGHWIERAADPESAVAKIEESHATSGSVGAGITDWAGMQAGRDALHFGYARDRRAMAVARGTGPDPCAFCAMLASRGFVYKSKAGATSTSKETTRRGNAAEFEADSSVRKFHLNCHCYPIVRWVDAPEVPDASKKFLADWNTITRSHSGADKLRVFRRWFDQQRLAAKNS